MSHSVESPVKIHHFLGGGRGVCVKIWGPRFAHLFSGNAKGASLGLPRELK